MYFISRALKYLRRKLGKTLLMGIIFLVIANFALAGLLIRQASIKAQEQTRLSIGADISYITNYDTFMADIEKGIVDKDEIGRLKGNQGLFHSEILTEGGAPTYSNILQAVDSDYVDSYSIGVGFEVVATDIKQYQVDSSATNTSTFQVSLYDNGVPDVFENKTTTLIDGRMITEEELASGSPVILIEQNVGSLNHIRIGDTIAVTYPEVKNQSYTIDHEVVGIYITTEEIEQWAIQQSNAAGFPQNRFYVPFNLLSSVGYEQNDINHIMIDNNVIKLKDPENLEAYREEVESRMNLHYGVLDANDDLYESLVGPIEMVGMISNVAVTIILITGGVIIGLITALTVNERRGEIGILLAVGESKFKIVSQFVMEVLVIAILTFSLSIFTGGIIGNQISQSALGSELLQTEQEANYGKGRNAKNTKTMPKEDVEMDITLSMDVIASLFAMGISLSVISTIIPALYVMRFNPKQILSNRNS